MLNSLPQRPLLVREVENLSDNSDRIADATPLTVFEVSPSTTIAVSFILSLEQPAYFGFVFDREQDSWISVFEEHYDEVEEARDGFQNVNEAIMEYWEERSETIKAGEVDAEGDGTFDEMTVSDLSPEVYLDYFR